MPQLPTSTPAEEYGAEDEVKQYTQEEDDCSDTSTVDVVNDIKGDLLCEDSPDSKTNDENLYRNPRYEKSESGGLYGSPAAVIVGPHNRYYDQSYRFNGGSQTYNNTYPTTRPSYTREGRPYYDHASWPQPPSGPQYPVFGGPQQKYYRYGGAIPGHGVPYYAAYPSMVGRPQKEIKRPHVKKPLNAFMLYMKEQRPKIAAEFTLKESAAINQILGKRWHALEKSEQAKYYEMARKERAIHMQLYPGWSARDNYAQIGRKKKRPRDKNEEMNPKKCRARYGLDRQEQWCKPCRRKKKCIRFIVGADGETTEVSEKQNETSDSDEDSSKDSKQTLHSLVSMAHSNNNNATNSSVHNNNVAVSQIAHNTAVSTIHTNNNNSSNNHNDESNKFESTHSTDNNNDVSITSSSLKSSQIYTERTITTLQTVTSSNNVISCS